MTFVLGVLLKHWKVTAIAAIGVLLLVAFAHWRRGIVNQGIAIERGRVADSTLAVVTPERIKAETTLVERIRVVTRIVRDTLIVDRWRHDTVYVVGDTTPRLAVPVTEIARRDTLERACTALAADCTSFRLLANTELAALRSKVATIPVASPKSCTLSNVLVGLLGVGAGVGVGYLAHRP